jgi:hypothetical protein
MPQYKILLHIISVENIAKSRIYCMETKAFKFFRAHPGVKKSQRVCLEGGKWGSSWLCLGTPVEKGCHRGSGFVLASTTRLIPSPLLAALCHCPLVSTWDLPQSQGLVIVPDYSWPSLTPFRRQLLQSSMSPVLLFPPSSSPLEFLGQFNPDLIDYWMLHL